jgi:hypothetical protein
LGGEWEQSVGSRYRGGMASTMGSRSAGGQSAVREVKITDVECHESCSSC